MLFGTNLVSDVALVSCAFSMRCVSVSISLILGLLLVFVAGNVLVRRALCMHDDAGAILACRRLVILALSINWVMLSMFTSWHLFGDAGVPIVN